MGRFQLNILVWIYTLKIHYFCYTWCLFYPPLNLFNLFLSTNSNNFGNNLSQQCPTHPSRQGSQPNVHHHNLVCISLIIIISTRCGSMFVENKAGCLGMKTGTQSKFSLADMQWRKRHIPLTSLVKSQKSKLLKVLLTW